MTHSTFSSSRHPGLSFGVLALLSLALAFAILPNPAYNFFALDVFSGLVDADLTALANLLAEDNVIISDTAAAATYSPHSLTDRPHRSVTIAWDQLRQCGADCAAAYIDSAPAGDGARLFSGLLAYREGQTDDAVAAWQMLSYPDIVLTQLGHSEYLKGEYEAALALFAAALPAIETFTIDHGLLLGDSCIIHRIQGDLALALDSCRQYVSVVGSSSAWLLLGRAQLEAGEAAPAVDSFRQSLAIGPQTAAHYRWLADALTATGAYSEAEDTYLTSIALDRAYGWNLLGLAQLYQEVGRPSEAEALLRTLTNHEVEPIRSQAVQLLDQ